jgi:enamine deaminase RidA (YjgF/YER057c/UK114 family)
LAADGTIPEGITAQTDLTLQRIAATLSGEGLSLKDVVSCTVYLTDKADFAAFNAAYAKHFTDPLPVRTTVEAQLMIDAKIEITVIAQAAA